MTIHGQFDALRAWIRAHARVSPKPQTGSVRLDLGTKTIKGINVHGYRTNTTWMHTEHGTAKPSETVTEDWRDSDLGMDFLDVQYSQEGPSASYKRELVDVKLGEPDPALLKPPSDNIAVIKEPLLQVCPTQWPGGTTPTVQLAK